MEHIVEQNHKATHLDMVAVEAVAGLSTSDRHDLTKSVEAYLADMCSDSELEASVMRLCDLYWKATIPETPFSHGDVDVFAVGALQALKTHSSPQSALDLTDYLRRARRASRNEPFHATSILYTVGVDIDS